jgi:hypothetical protein
VNGGRFIMVILDGTYHKVKFMDTLNYGGFSVEAMGKILGIPKLIHPACLGRMPRNEKEKQELIKYNKRDCEVSRNFMIMLQDVINLEGGELKSTVSSCALDIYRRKFLPFNMIREEVWNGLRVKKYVYEAYYGGRTEVFGRGKIENYNYYDVNSLYPYCMLGEFPIPHSVQYYNNETSGFDIKSLLQYEGVAWFKLNIPYSKYPLLPYRYNGRLVFPIGRFSGYYTHLEIRRAIELYGKDIILDMKECVYYTKTYKVFEKYVHFMYGKRMENKEKKSPFEVFYKLMLNSLYGRFAMKNISNTEFFFAETDKEIVKQIKHHKDTSKFDINPNKLSYVVTDSMYDGISSIPIWSCYVTAYARVLMHKYICETKPVYIDTDSLFTKTIIKTSKLLGDLKLEDTIKHGIVIKPKAYFVNEAVKFKGMRIPKDTKHIDRLKKNVLAEKPLRFEKFVKMKEGIKRNMLINSIIIVEKHMNLEDIKRDWKGKKFNPYEFQDSEPLRIQEEEK